VNVVKPLERATSSDDVDGLSSGAAAGRGWLRRRATLRPDLRAAMALEEAGELLEAARVFEYAGEHAQAAALRVEIARTLPDRAQRIDILREGCARIPGSSPEARVLHAALAELLLADADVATDPATRRAAKLEAARALEEADEGSAAGEIYEELGLLSRAAAAYERGGDVARLELVFAVLEHREQHDARLRAIEAVVEEAMVLGQRAHAHAMLLEHGRMRHGGELPPAHVAARLDQLEHRLVRGHELELRWGGGRHTRICGAPGFRIGRAPDAELLVPVANLSRHHAELRLDASGERTQLVVVDLGSKVGTFLDGEHVPAGEPMPIVGTAMLGLGSHAAITIVPIRATGGGAGDHDAGALVSSPGDPRTTVWLPRGGRLWLDAEVEIPATVLFDRSYVALDFRPGVGVALDGRDLGNGASIDLLRGDRITVRGTTLSLEVAG
jgi:hypothetical protein